MTTFAAILTAIFQGFLPLLLQAILALLLGMDSAA